MSIGVICSIVGAVISIGSILIKLNTSINTLNITVANMQKLTEQLTQTAADHEKRISRLEYDNE